MFTSRTTTSALRLQTSEQVHLFQRMGMGGNRRGDSPAIAARVTATAIRDVDENFIMNTFCESGR